MNKNLEILDFEDKTTQANKAYVRFKTNEGWMSCFDITTCNELKQQTGKTVSVDIKIDSEKGFTNILKYLGESAPVAEETKQVPYVAPAKECHLSIEQVRSNALDMALKNNANASDEGLVKSAETFEKYILG